MPITDDWDFNYSAKELSHIDGVLSYDTGTGAQADVGDYIRGNTSGAIGKILARTGNVTSGTLTLTNVVGLFQDNETFEVLSTLGFDAVTAGNGGFAVGDVIAGQTSTDTITVRFIEYNQDGLGGGTIYGDTLTGSAPYFQDNEQLNIQGGQADVADAVGAATDNSTKLGTTQTQGTLAVPGTANTNDSCVIHYDGGTVAIPEQAIVEDATTGARGLVEQVYGVTAVGSVRIVDYDSTGGAFTNNNTLRADQVIAYDGLQAGEVFSPGDVVVGGTSGATGRVLLDTGTELILADESGTWTNNEQLQVGGTYIADANGTNTTLNLATLNMPSGIRTEQRPNSIGGGSGQGGIYASADGINIVRKLNSLYTLSQDTFDELTQLDDDEAMDAAAKAIAYSLVFDWFVPDLSMRFVRSGALVDTSGANVWANPQSVGAQNKITDTAFLYNSAQPYRQPQLYIEQNALKVDAWWLEGQIDVLLKVRTRTDTRFIAPATPGLGQLIPGGDPSLGGSYAVFNREYHVSTYDATQVDAPTGGVNTVALGTQDDTAADRNPNGTHTMDYTGGSAAALIVGEEFTAGSGNSLKVGVVVSDTGGVGATGTLEYVLKSGTNFVNTDACTATISGKTFTAPNPTTVVAGYGSDIAFPVVDIAATPSGGTGITGTFVPGEPVTQAVTGATGILVYADTATNVLYLEVSSGTFSGNNDITGDNSAASWDAGTGATYPSDTDFNADLNNGEGANPYTGAVSGNLTGGGSPQTVQNIYQFAKYLTAHESDTIVINGPGTSDGGNVGRFFRRLADAFSEIKPGAPIGTFTGTLTLGQGWFLDSGYIAAADIRSFAVRDNNGVLRNPPNLQSLEITGGFVGVRTAAFRAPGAGQLSILRSEFDVGTVGAGNNQAADNTILVGANTRTVSPLPADVPDTGILYVLDPNDTGNYLQFPYSSVNRTTNVFTLASGTIGTVTGGQDLTLDDNVHVAFIRDTMAGASINNTIQYVADIPIFYVGRIKGRKPFRGSTTFGSGGASAPLTLNVDPVVDLP